MDDELTATVYAPGDKIVNAPMSASIVETEQELVISALEPDLTPTSTVGFVKRWTRKIVGWVKRVFRWRKD